MTSNCDHKQPLPEQINYVVYQSEAQMPEIIKLIQEDLSEPYSVYTYRYFINNWSKLCFLAYDGDQCVGAIVCKLDVQDARNQQTSKPNETVPSDAGNQLNDDSAPMIFYKGYIAMLVVRKEYRKLRIGSKLVRLAVNAMRESRVDEVVLETEVTNKPALRLYGNLGFLRDKRMFRYYLNGLDALRLKLWLDTSSQMKEKTAATTTTATTTTTNSLNEQSLSDAMASVVVNSTQSSDHHDIQETNHHSQPTTNSHSNNRCVETNSL